VSEVEGLAALPHLTESELAVLLGAVDSRRLHLMAQPLADHGDEVRVLWSLSTAVSEALIAAKLDGERRRADGPAPARPDQTMGPAAGARWRWRGSDQEVDP
jgi:hypothetical protein